MKILQYILTAFTLTIIFPFAHADEINCDKNNINPVQVNYGDIINCSTSQSSDVDIYVLPVNKGDMVNVSLSLGDDCDTYLAQLSVYNPDSISVASDGGYSQCYDTRVSFTASETQVYSITVSERDNSFKGSGDYRIVFQCISGSCIQTTLLTQDKCAATFINNSLHVPCLSLGAVSYWLDMPLISPNPIQFQLNNFGLVSDRPNETLICDQNKDGGQCVAYVRNYFGGIYDTMPGLCVHTDCGAYHAYDDWDLGFGKGKVPRENSIMVINNDVLALGHMAVIVAVENNNDGTYNLIAQESNWDGDELVDCDVSYRFNANTLEVSRNGGSWYGLRGFVYSDAD